MRKVAGELKDLLEELAEVGMRFNLDPYRCDDAALRLRQSGDYFGEGTLVPLDTEVFGTDRQHTRDFSPAARCAECGVVTWLVRPTRDGKGSLAGKYRRGSEHAPGCSRPEGRIDRLHNV